MIAKRGRCNVPRSHWGKLGNFGGIQIGDNMVCLGFEAKQRFDRSGVTSCLANSSALREQNGLKFGTIVEYNGMVSYDFCQIFWNASSDFWLVHKIQFDSAGKSHRLVMNGFPVG